MLSSPDSNRCIDETKTAQAGAGEQAKFEEIIRKVQQCLIKLGHLPACKSDGSPSDDGILNDTTRDAINRFFAAEGITAEERVAAFGEETDPDYWHKLLEQLEGRRNDDDEIRGGLMSRLLKLHERLYPSLAKWLQSDLPQILTNPANSIRHDKQQLSTQRLALHWFAVVACG
jgi:hypothetical protein